MKKIFVILLALIVFVGCSNEESIEGDISVKTITAEQAKELMVEGNIILDVREPNEYSEGHVEGAVLLPLGDIQSGNYGDLDDKDQIILVYCRSGRRSAVAAKALADAGYTNIHDFGGINDWPYEVVK